MTIEWESFGEGWRRASFEVPGYDDRESDHGIYSGRYGYLVSNGECTLALEVSSGIYPPTVTHVAKKPADGNDLSLHVPWPAGRDEEDVENQIRHGSTGRECSFIEAGRCWIAYSTALGAGTFFKEHGVDSFVQPESFWEALRARASELIADARAKHAKLEHLRQCPTCRGRGLVTRDTKAV